MHDKINIIGFSDNHPSLQGSNIYVNGQDTDSACIPCIDPKNIDKGTTVIISAAPNYYSEIKKQMQALQLEAISADEFVFEYFADEIKCVEGYLTDEQSRNVYRQILKSRINYDLPAIEQIYSPNQYFALPEFMNFSGHEIFIDAGSYCGDILDIYINSRCGLFKKIYAFEPGRKQFLALQYRAERLRREWALEEGQIVCVNGAVSDYSGSCYFETVAGNPATSRMGMEEHADGSTAVYKLDDFLTDGADFIKVDIEGQEMKLLKGAVQTIQKYRPKLAICLYHTPFDLFEIPAYIKEIVPDYQMEIRHHTYNTSETVLYAYCK